MQYISDLHSKFALRHIMCGSMVDIQSPTVEIRRGKNKRKEERKNMQDKNIMSASATQGGHNEVRYDRLDTASLHGVKLESIHAGVVLIFFIMAEIFNV